VSGGGEPSVRLDGLDPGRGPRSFVFEDLLEEIRADRSQEVLGALERAGSQVRRGRHVAGFVAYEAAAGLDPAFRTAPADPRIPLVWLGVFGTRRNAGDLPRSGGWSLGEWKPSRSRSAYLRDVARIREWLTAGDTYQVNHTFRLRAPFRGDVEALYGDLCRAQRSAYCALLRLPEASIVSASPELFFRASGDHLQLRPMKGTRRRGRWPEEDRALADELRSSPKERAENLMIVDLLRNDAGRIAEFGSVHVPRLFEVERYPTVLQLTSTIEARLAAGTGLSRLFGALFPCGSVTGAPKVRTMEIIAALEDEPRGVYTGAIGFASPDETVFAVAIRTLVLDPTRGTAELGVGSGITVDSDAAAEYRECLDKAAFVRMPVREFRLLETLRYDPGVGFTLLEEHLDRMESSAAYFSFGFDRPAAEQALEAAVSPGSESLRLRLLLDRSGRIEVERSPLPTAAAPPLRLRIAAEPVDSRDPLLYHKTTAREPYDRRRAACGDCDEALLVNERGELTEGCTTNLLVELDGRWWTPPLPAGLLPGVYRRYLLERGEVEERTLTPDDLQRATRIRMINSVRGAVEGELLGWGGHDETPLDRRSGGVSGDPRRQERA
jgi:para-aminobenzoate synthetase / 4-amino-4-deoxychorismate lyase